jgi:hypothetical protein
VFGRVCIGAIPPDTTIECAFHKGILEFDTHPSRKLLHGLTAFAVEILEPHSNHLPMIGQPREVWSIAKHRLHPTVPFPVSTE